MTDDMSLNLIYEDETISNIGEKSKRNPTQRDMTSNKEIRKVYCLVEVDLVN